MSTATLTWRDAWPWAAAALGILLFLWALAPVLTPFVLGAGLAYLGNPVVDALERRRLGRTAAVSIVFVVLSLAGLVLALLIVPLVYQQAVVLLRKLPEALLWVQDVALPTLGISLPEGVALDAEGLKALIGQHWAKAGDWAAVIGSRLAGSGTALLALAASLLMVPIVTFYLLRDWPRLLAWINAMIPPRHRPTVAGLAREADGVLSAFIRGQLSVMAALAVFYSLGLSLAGLDLALVIGVGAGLISFVPYLGTVVGVAAALLAMFLQTGEWLPLIWVALVFGIGQILEGAVLTPVLVGDRIGLHPVTVIFAVLAGGQLFGFVGVLLALPTAAVLAVLLRHGKARWLQSRLYLG